MNVLFIGDVVGKPGRQAVQAFLKPIQSEYHIDLTIANGENAAGGNGLTKDVAQELFGFGIEFITMGNHVWDKREIMTYIEEEARIIRPANYPLGAPGKGYGIIRRKGVKVGIVNLSGRIFMPTLDDPFSMASRLAEMIRQETPNIFLDFHAEATSEKIALGWFLDGKVSAILGTHTHVQTADERLLTRGTAYITDVGMTGPRDSVLGVKKELIINRFLTQLPAKFEIAAGVLQFNAVVVDLDETSGRARSITRIQRFSQD
ncbi:MAG: TIGR00282 family metallophosphoesterase [Desulfitobacteriaceae bacterium]|nr:TIGR00282 family metallophosphoesterase [Desulfitobacteriaceae bacterium]MDI6878542.1 TIGR00282 family metallophosphoesterase [Desulfitobacteriaceae bacterium]MDI6915769.1 TIGR00282 family metallophosphoesterase [Desulfitobacteriaceae bacterium]